jgi:thiol-disulfide isomerase/thioredoxin
LKAKDFPVGHTWLNSKPLSFQGELKNKLVLIDFWTYCCINCLHVLPDMEYLETKFA